MTLAVDRAYVVQTLTGLVRINSVNPSIATDGPGEAEIAAYVSGALRALGLETVVYEPQPGRATAVGRLRGTGGGRSLMLNGHADTVGVDDMPEPFAAAVRGGRLYGRGAHDMKGSLAACIGAAKTLVDAGIRLRGDLVIAAVADEEYGSLGTADLIGRCPVDAAIVTEPTNLEICLAHKGYIWFDVETTGRAAHGSRFTEGIDAIMHMGRVLAGLDALEQALRTGPAHPMVGPPSLHAALINGGSGLSTYASSCHLKIERRTIPGETEATALAQIQQIIDRLAAADPAFRATVSPFFVRHPFEVSPEAGIVRVLGGAAREVLGRQPAFVGDTPWMDAALLAEAGVETVVMGPLGAGEHSIEEWVDLDSVCQMAEILARAAIGYCS
ncbi:MAG: ArgE/DapE family deacylase [Planctomycetes bacterium]|nr:ArgE/DapE family deacylase [Planctomycetota bacterium]